MRRESARRHAWQPRARQTEDTGRMKMEPSCGHYEALLAQLFQSSSAQRAKPSRKRVAAGMKWLPW